MGCKARRTHTPNCLRNWKQRPDLSHHATRGQTDVLPNVLRAVDCPMRWKIPPCPCPCLIFPLSYGNSPIRWLSSSLASSLVPAKDNNKHPQAVSI